MKQFFILTGMLLATHLSFAQAWNGTSDQKLQVGISTWGNGKGLTGTYDYGVSNFISVGAGLNLYFDNKKDEDFFLFGRANFHLQETLNLPDQWDIYPGLDIGVLGNTFGLGLHFGARYFFNQKFGAFVEVGNNGSLGVSVSF